MSVLISQPDNQRFNQGALFRAIIAMYEITATFRFHLFFFFLLSFFNIVLRIYYYCILGFRIFESYFHVFLWTMYDNKGISIMFNLCKHVPECETSTLFLSDNGPPSSLCILDISDFFGGIIMFSS